MMKHQSNDSSPSHPRAHAAAMRAKRLLGNASLLAALGVAGLIGSACSSSDENGDGPGQGTFNEAEASNYSYLTDDDVANFHQQLVEYSDELRADQDVADYSRTQSSLRQRLSQQALNYQNALSSGINDSESTHRRMVSAAMLGFTGNPTYAYILARKATDDEERIEVRIMATAGLFELGEAINQSNKRDDVMFALRQLMLPNTRSPMMRVNCVTAYARAYSAQQGDSLTPLMNVLDEDPDPDVRRQVLYELRAIGDPSVVPALSTIALDDPDVQTRSIAALALGGIKHPESLETLLMASEEDAAEVRMQAVFSLALIADSTNQDIVVDTLINAMNDVDVDVRRAAASAAASLDDPRLVEPLSSATSDRNDRVRKAAIDAMAVVVKKDSEREAYVLVNALDDPDPEVSNASFRALKRITDANLRRDSEEWRDWFYDQYPDLNPETQYKDSPRPPWSGTGIGSSSRRSTGSTTRTNRGGRRRR